MSLTRPDQIGAESRGARAERRRADTAQSTPRTLVMGWWAASRDRPVCFIEITILASFAFATPHAVALV